MDERLKHFKVCITEKEIKRACKIIAKHDVIAVDTEGTGLHVVRDRITMIPIKAGEHSFVFPVRMATQSNANIKVVKKYLAPILYNKKIRKRFWNAKHDMHMLRNDGMKVRNYWDAMVAGWLLDENESNSLKTRCKLVGLELAKFGWKTYFRLREKWFKYLNVKIPERPVGKPRATLKKKDPDLYWSELKKFDKRVAEYKEWKKSNKPLTPKEESKLRELETEMLAYAYEDSLATDLLGDLFEKELSLKENRELFLVFTKVWNPYVRVLYKIERRGMCVDMEYIEETRKAVEEKMAECLRNVYKVAGTVFKVNSNKELANVLFNLLKVPAIRVSKKTGNPSADATALTLLSRIPKDRDYEFGHELFKAKYPIANAILKYRFYEKLYGTYLAEDSTMMKGIHNGFIHTSYNPCGTDTGRLSSSGPNLQNIPRSTPDNFYLRKMFIPPKGYRYFIGDESQFELRLIADKSGDAKLIEAYQNNEDIHEKTLKGCGVPDRTTAKNLNFGAFYGIHDEKFSTMLTVKTGKLVTPEQANEYLAAFFELYSGVPKYTAKLFRWARKNGCMVKTYLGRRRRLPELNSPRMFERSRAERQAWNTQIQGGVADIMTLCMLRVDRDPWFRKNKVYMVGQVHDEVHFIVPWGVSFDEVAKRTKAIFEHPFARPLKVPLVFSVPDRFSYSWHDAK